MKTVKNENGFAIAPILLAIALIGIIAGAIAVASRTATVSTVEHTAKMAASTVIQQMSNLNTGYTIMLSRALHPSEITWDNATNTGIFHPTDGGTSEQRAPVEALANPEPTHPGYVYKVDSNGNPVVKIKGIGITDNADYVVALPGVKKAVCEQINKTVLGSTNIPVGSGTLANWGSAATVVDMSDNSNIEKLSMACIKTTDASESYVFYSVLRER